MTGKERRPIRFSKGLFGRLILSYFVVPFISSVLLLIKSFDRRTGIADWLGLVLLFGIFGLAAMLILGTPLVFCYLRLGWTGFLPFLLGGGICAAITARVFLPVFVSAEPSPPCSCCILRCRGWWRVRPSR